MILTFRRPCPDHRAALLDWVDRRERGPRTEAALAHLAHCPGCEAELAEVALTVTALHRLAVDVAAAEPPRDAWIRLRSRISRPADPWRWRTSLGGLATSAMLVAVLVMPISLGDAPTTETGSELPRVQAEVRRERAWLASARARSLPPTAPIAAPVAAPVAEIRSGGSVPLHPPEIARVRKEVLAQPAHGRSTRPI